MIQQSEKPDTIVALLGNPKDLSYLKNEGWYRFRENFLPTLISNGKATHIAFYQQKSFGENAFRIQYYGKIASQTSIRRDKLLSQELNHPRSNDYYRKVTISNLIRLEPAISNYRRRRILFLNSTVKRIATAQEINEVILGSPIEERMWSRFVQEKIPVEREYVVSTTGKTFSVDFAVLCKNRKIAIECDGDSYHLAEKEVKYDKQRDNILEAKGWTVLRYHTEDITHNLDDSIRQIKDTINASGGAEHPLRPNRYEYFRTEEGNLFQIRLFEG
jgi:very-short-patch-repair endonuclease